MTSTHEAILAALVTALDGHAMDVTREPDAAQAVGATGLLVVAPGDPAEQGRTLGVVRREWERAVELEHIVAGDDDAARIAAIDTALRQTVTLLAGETLGGRVDHLDLSGPEEADQIPYPGAETLRGAVLIARLYYTTSDNPMEQDP